MVKWKWAASLAAVMLLLPVFSYAQGVADKIHSLHSVLDMLYEEMMPLCEKVILLARGIAGFGALWYIASRVWRHIANAEAVDFYPLFRPFVIGFIIIFFGLFLKMIDGLMKPLVTGTADMVRDSDKAIAILLKQQEEAIKNSPAWQMYEGENGKGDRDAWYKYTHDGEDPRDEKWYNALGNAVKFSMAKASFGIRNMIKEYMSEVLRVLFQAASLCVNTLRTFQMVVLAILGPIAFAISIYDGMQQTLGAWLARFLNVYLWLPVGNVFGAIIGKIQENMIKLNLSQIKETGDSFFSATDTGYLIFLLIGIVGYTTVPSVAGFIVHVLDGGGLTKKMTSLLAATPGMAASAGRMAGGVATAGLGAARSAKATMGNYAKMGKFFDEGLSGKASGSGITGAIGRAVGRRYMANKLAGAKKEDKK